MIDESAERQELEPSNEAREPNELDVLRGELEDATKKGKEYLDSLQRVQADFVNYRRRIEQERKDQAETVKARVILRFLPILDDMQRAMDSLPPEIQDSDWAKGVRLIQQKLWHTLESEGVQRMDVIGRQFDPWEHDAVLYEEGTSEPEGKILSVLRDGYKLDGRVIRPAQVIVAK